MCLSCCVAPAVLRLFVYVLKILSHSLTHALHPHLSLYVSLFSRVGLDAPGQRMLLNIMSRDGRGVLPRMMFPDMMMGQGGDDIDNMSYEQLLELSQVRVRDV